MSEFSVRCHVCNGEVTSYDQTIRYILTNDEAIQESQSTTFSCGCVADFPDWQIDLKTGQCRIVDFSGTLFIEFWDKELIMEEDE